MTRHIAPAIALSALIAAASGQALAMGEDTNSPATPKKPECKDDQVYSEQMKRCVQKDQKDDNNNQTKEKEPDRALIEKGWKLAYREDFKLAAEVFHSVANKNDPKALNGLGYTSRKLGHLEQGIAYYKRAIKIDPNYLLAREYLGEGYVLAGMIDLAREQLTEIENRCGTSCKEYRKLSRVIATGSENDW